MRWEENAGSSAPAFLPGRRREAPPWANHLNAPERPAPPNRFTAPLPRPYVSPCDDLWRQTCRWHSTTGPPVFRARAVAAPQPALARLSRPDAGSWPDQSDCRYRVRRDRRLAGVRVLRAGCRPRLPRLPSQLSQRPAKRDDPAGRRCIHGRAGGCAGRAPCMAVPAVLAAGDSRRACRRCQPIACRFPWPQLGGWQSRDLACPPRARGGDPRGAQTLARCAQPRLGRVDELETEHLLQAVERRRPTDDPARRLHCTLRVHGAARRAVGQLEAFAGAGKDYVVVADRVTPAQRGEPDAAGAAGAGNAVPGALLHFFKFCATTLGYRAAKRECRARG